MLVLSSPVRQDESRVMIVRAREHVFTLDTRVLIVGILNVTPDSFSDGGRFLDAPAALDRVHEMVEEGADVIDIGAESTRPGSRAIDEAEELRRLTPVLRAVAHRSPVPLSIDTQKAAVARVALDHGVAIVNDVSAMRADPHMPAVVAQFGAGVVLMHMRGEPATMHQAPAYTDVIREVKAFLADRMAVAEEAGIQPEQIVLDPGIGFGKNTDHNCTIVANLQEFRTLGRPLMVGVSRKSFVGEIVRKPVERRLWGTAGAVAVAVMQGAQLIRVHDVQAMKDVASVANALCLRRDAGRAGRQ